MKLLWIGIDDDDDDDDDDGAGPLDCCNVHLLQQHSKTLAQSNESIVNNS